MASDYSYQNHKKGGVDCDMACDAHVRNAIPVSISTDPGAPQIFLLDVLGWRFGLCFADSIIHQVLGIAFVCREANANLLMLQVGFFKLFSAYIPSPS